MHPGSQVRKVSGLHGHARLPEKIKSMYFKQPGKVNIAMLLTQNL